MPRASTRARTARSRGAQAPLTSAVRAGKAERNHRSDRRAGGPGLDQSISAHGHLCKWCHAWLFLHGLLLHEVSLHALSWPRTVRVCGGTKGLSAAPCANRGSFLVALSLSLHEQNSRAHRTYAKTHPRPRAPTHPHYPACHRNPRLATLYLKRVKTVLAYEKERQQQLKAQTVSVRRQMCERTSAFCVRWCRCARCVCVHCMPVSAGVHVCARAYV